MVSDRERRQAVAARIDTVPLAARIDALAEQHGSMRAAARVLGVDAGYLSRLRRGVKKEPGDALLRKMGLRRVVTYERVR